MKITIELKDEVATNYATYHGWSADLGVTVADYVTFKLLDRISNDTLELANRTVIAEVVPVKEITTDNKQAALRSQIDTARKAKFAPIETPIEEPIIKGGKL